MRSLFEEPMRFDGSQLHVLGPVTEMRHPNRPHHVLWMVAQGDHVVSGRTPVEDGHWHDHAPGKPGDWESGPALAAGLVVVLRRDGSAGTFAWSQQVQISA
jgi:hypothetical protein